MDPHELPRAAEEIRQEIKGMIPETAILEDQHSEIQAKILKEDENGTKAYGGDPLAAKISRLTGKMGIGIVCTSHGILRSWTDQVLGLEISSCLLVGAYQTSK